MWSLLVMDNHEKITNTNRWEKIKACLEMQCFQILYEKDNENSQYKLLYK